MMAVRHAAMMASRRTPWDGGRRKGFDRKKGRDVSSLEGKAGSRELFV